MHFSPSITELTAGQQSSTEADFSFSILSPRRDVCLLLQAQLLFGAAS